MLLLFTLPPFVKDLFTNIANQFIISKTVKPLFATFGVKPNCYSRPYGASKHEYYR